MVRVHVDGEYGCGGVVGETIIIAYRGVKHILLMCATHHHASLPKNNPLFLRRYTKTGGSRARTTIVTEKPADFSATMTRNAYYTRNTTPTPNLSYMDSALRSTLRHNLLRKRQAKSHPYFIYRSFDFATLCSG